MAVDLWLMTVFRVQVDDRWPKSNLIIIHKLIIVIFYYFEILRIGQ
jgi:hypothetical protein